MVATRQEILRKCAGLSTILDPFQPIDIKGADGQTVKRYVAKAINARVTDSGSLERGYTASSVPLVNLTNGHSFYCDQSDALVHDGGSMFGGSTMAELIASTAKRTGMSGAPVDHTRYGQAIYYGNRQERGRYVNGAHEEWVVDSYHGPLPTSRQFASYAPVFDHLAAFNGMILFSFNNHLFVTEPRFPGCWEKLPVWSTDTRITMIKPVVTDTYPVSGGVFISDEKRISYLGGLNPQEFPEPRTTNYPAIEWSVAHGYADGSTFGEKSGLVAVFGTTKGLCLGYPDGTLVNVQQAKIKMPIGASAGATLIYGHNIISTMG